MKRFLVLILFFILILQAPAPAFAAASTTAPATYSQNYAVMDVATGQVLVEKGMDQMVYPASLTKIMTALLALENIDDLDTMHTMSVEATHSVPRESTHIALTQGEVISLRDLLYATMVTSANDAANGVAECVAGSMDAFVEMMNRKAKEIGAVHTNFVNPNGLHDPNHYTTPYDMALITQYALSVEGFREFWMAPEHTIQPTNMQPQVRNLGTQHSMFVESQYTYEGCTGGKLGYTDEANHTGATTAKRGDIELICITMKSKKYEKFEDAAALFDYCFDSFRAVSLTKRHLKGFEIPVFNGGTKVQNVLIYPDNEISFLLHHQLEAEDLVLEYNVPEQYLYGEPIVPLLSLSLSGEREDMYWKLGDFQLEYVLEDLQVQQVNVSLPVKDTTPFWEKMPAAFLWVCAGMGVLLLLALAVFAAAWIRRSILQHRRRKRLEARRAGWAQEYQLRHPAYLHEQQEEERFRQKKGGREKGR